MNKQQALAKLRRLIGTNLGAGGEVPMSAHDLRDVSVGDAVAVMSGIQRGLCVKRTVSKVTQTQVTLDDGSRWLRKGRKVGGRSWERDYAKPWDEAEHRLGQVLHQRDLLTKAARKALPILMRERDVILSSNQSTGKVDDAEAAALVAEFDTAIDQIDRALRETEKWIADAMLKARQA